jgi:hypothetical protein
MYASWSEGKKAITAICQGFVCFPEDISKYTLQFINIRLLAIWKI